MPKTSRLDELKLQLKNELQRSLLLDEEDRQFWLAQLDNLPITTIQSLLAKLSPRNEQVDDFINTALAQDQNQEHISQLKQEIGQIKKQAMKLEEKSSIASERHEEEELLSQLDDL